MAMGLLFRMMVFTECICDSLALSQFDSKVHPDAQNTLLSHIGGLILGAAPGFSSEPRTS